MTLNINYLYAVLKGLSHAAFDFYFGLYDNLVVKE